jgi:hypothetical protein
MVSPLGYRKAAEQIRSSRNCLQALDIGSPNADPRTEAKTSLQFQ